MTLTSSAAPGSSAASLWLVLAPPPRHGCVSSQPCSSHPPPLSDGALLLFHRENRKEPFQSLHNQVCHLSRVCTKFSALCLLTLRSHLRANLMPRTPSSVFLVKNFAPVMNELPFFFSLSTGAVLHKYTIMLLGRSCPGPQHTGLLGQHCLPEFAQTHVL